MDLQDAIEFEALMHFTDRMFAGKQKAKIERALGPGFDAFDGIVTPVDRAIGTGVPVDRESADGLCLTKSNPDISVMQSAEDWATKNTPCSLHGA
jgi:hypothetical protein